MNTVLGPSPGDRLRTLRELLGLTGGGLSELCGISQTAISYIETHRREATEEQLRLIAERTGTPLSFFYARPSTIPLDSLHFRKLASASRTVTKRIQAFFGE